MKGRRRANLFPAWITDHADFETEIKAEYEYLLGQHERSQLGFQRLGTLKKAMRKSAKYFKHKAAKMKPQTTEHRISATIAFLRALGLGDLQTARKMQGIYETLNQVNLKGS